MKAAKIDSSLIQFYSGTNSPVHFLLSVLIYPVFFLNSKLLTKIQIVGNCDIEKFLTILNRLNLEHLCMIEVQMDAINSTVMFKDFKDVHFNLNDAFTV